jgi:hypothetical protein
MKYQGMYPRHDTLVGLSFLYRYMPSEVPGVPASGAERRGVGILGLPQEWEFDLTTLPQVSLSFSGRGFPRSSPRGGHLRYLPEPGVQ